MKLTIGELIIIADTLKGSLKIADGGNLFGYNKEARIKILNKFGDDETIKINATYNLGKKK